MKARKSFSLIELIMTIVILGIAFLGVPLILENSARTAQWLKSSQGIHHGVSKIQIVRSKFWDEENKEDFKNYGNYSVLKTDESSSINHELYCDYDNNRSGHYSGDGRRKCSNKKASVIVGNSDYDDINDFHGSSDTVDSFVLKTEINYIDYTDNKNEISLDSKASYETTTNIKEIIVKVSHTNGKKVSEYRYYGANIGTPTPYIKSNEQ